MRVNIWDFLRSLLSSTDLITIDGLDEDFSIVADDEVWLQIDTADGLTVSGVSVEHGTPPYATDGKLLTFTGTGTADDPYIWDQSFEPLARVYSSLGPPTHGGVIFSASATFVEVVQLRSTHLVMAPVLDFGRWAQLPRG